MASSRRVDPIVYDYTVIGGGILGLSTAWQLKQQEPDCSIVLLEKEARVSAHQTGRNSGVLHAGIYYEPNSLKARFCKQGVDATIQFCTEHNIPLEQCGKLVVAANTDEHERMFDLYDRAKENGLDVEILDARELARLEPNVVGIGAILVRETGIADFPKICEQLASNLKNLGGEVWLSSEVTAINESQQEISVGLAGRGVVKTRYLIACGGLMSDRLARLQGIDIDFRILPFRGEYYRLPSSKNDIVKHLIYPMPNKNLPFLGVHLTRMIDGSVTVGPNAVQGWKREGYARININLRDTVSILTFPGFWKISVKHFRAGVRELWNSISKKAFLKRVHVYCPELRIEDLLPYRTGVRAMAVRHDGSMVDDFLFVETKRSLHVCSAPSPAATSALPIGAHVAQTVLGKKLKKS